MPIESFLPILVLRYVGSFARSQLIAPDRLEYGFDPEMIYSKWRPHNSKKESMLKEINSQFSEVEEGQDGHAFSIIIDENAINGFILDFVLIEKSFSFREYLSMDPKYQGAVAQMTTNNIGMMLPQLLEEFGADKNVDVMFSLSHALIADKLEGQKATGFQIDKNGNFRIILNISVQLLVEKFKNKGMFEEARSIYLSLTAKGKLVVKEISETEKMLVIIPKNAEVGGLKIFKEDGEEMVMEQMMMTSAINLQFEQVIKMVQPQELPMKNPPTPKELECLGFGLGDVGLNFRKGFMEVTFGYHFVDEPSDPDICRGFFDAIRNGPKSVLDQAGDVLSEAAANPAQFLEKKKREL